MKVATAAPANPDELPLVNIETRSRFEMTFPGHRDRQDRILWGTDG
jgi:hypothetical protein